MDSNRRSLIAFAGLATAGLPLVAAETFLQGSGRAASERRGVTGFDRIAVAGAFEVELLQGDVEGVVLSGDDNLLAAVVTRVDVSGDGGTLRIEPRRGVRFDTATPIRVRAELKRLVALDFAGSGRIGAASLRSPRLTVNVAGNGHVDFASVQSERLSFSIGGSGDVEAAGRATRLAVSVAGSGRCSLGALEADDVGIDIAGSGEARVLAHQTLAVSIAGSGRVVHSGAAVPKVSVAGSGSVVRG